MFVGLLESFATLLYAFDTFVWLLSHSGSPMHSSAPLTGKSSVTIAFADLLELFVTLCVCMCVLCMPGQLLSPSFSSGYDLVLPVGESGGFGSAGPVLTCLCVSLAVFACPAIPCVSIHMFGVPVQLLDLTWSFVGHFSSLPSKLGYFAVY